MKAVASPMNTLASNPDRWVNQFELMLYTEMSEQELLPHMEFLGKMGLAESRPSDENGRVYKVTLKGVQHQERIWDYQRESSFPPPRISWPPVAA